MGTKATWALVVAASAVTGTGAVRAQDAVQEKTSSGGMVLPVGDKIHGYLRGGETHALQVHLAKGDVYSFSVTSQKRGDPLVMHLAMLDPHGIEVNHDARVMHFSNGKRVAVGPYVAPESGTYVIELSTQSWFPGEYWGKSSVRGARKTIVRLPAGGKTVDVEVAAGSKLQLRARDLSSLVMALPHESPNSFARADALVRSLRSTGLAVSETGVFQFAATGIRGRATIEVTKPRWNSAVVEFPALPSYAAGRLQWTGDRWTGFATTAPMKPPIVGAPIPVDGPSDGGEPATTFVGSGAAAASAVFAEHYVAQVEPTPTVPVPSDPATPSDPGTPTQPPVTSDPPTTDAPSVPAPSAPPTIARLSWRPDGVSTGNLGIIPTNLMGQSAFWMSTSQASAATKNVDTWRWTPWMDDGALPSSAAAVAFPARLEGTTQRQDVIWDATRTNLLQVRWTYALVHPVGADGRPISADGTVVITQTRTIDGHPAPINMLASKGHYASVSVISGSGTINGVAWTLDGRWTNTSVLMDPVTIPLGGLFVAASNELIGSETYRAGNLVETVSTPGILWYAQACEFANVVGSIENKVSIVGGAFDGPTSTYYETIVRELPGGDAGTATMTVNLTDTKQSGTTNGMTLSEPEVVQTSVEFPWWCGSAADVVAWTEQTRLAAAAMLAGQK